MIDREPDVAQRVLAEAAIWRIRLEESGEATNAELEQWLAEDDSHAAAWHSIMAAWNFFGDQAASLELIEARREALSDARSQLRRRWLGGVGRKVAAAAAVLFVIAGAALALIVWENQPDDYRTARGERRFVALTDGSSLTLDSDTDIQVRYAKHVRLLTLLKGQARFDVAHDIERPFIVVARGKKIVATGTAFDVGISGSDLSVTLIQGRVSVLDSQCCSKEPSGSLAPIQMLAGEQLTASPGHPVLVKKVAVEHATAWERSEIEFDNTPLAEVMHRMSQYSPVPIVIADANARNLRLSGVFKTDDINGFVETVTRYLPVTSAVGQDGKISLSSRR